MNSYLLNRALGSIAPSTFHTAQTARLVHHLEPAPGIRFSSKHQAEFEGHGLDTEGDIYAHRAGANVLAIDQYDGRWWVKSPARRESVDVLAERGMDTVWYPAVQTHRSASGI